jgi:hypothetical protein
MSIGLYVVYVKKKMRGSKRILWKSYNRPMTRKQLNDAARIALALGAKLCPHGRVQGLCGRCEEAQSYSSGPSLPVPEEPRS